MVARRSARSNIFASRRDVTLEKTLRNPHANHKGGRAGDIADRKKRKVQFGLGSILEKDCLLTTHEQEMKE